jgi:hypothetical protein
MAPDVRPAEMTGRSNSVNSPTLIALSNDDDVEFIKYVYADTPNKGENLFPSALKKIPSSLQ